MKRFRINGTELACVETGQGDPVLFIHGIFNDYRSWERQLDVFAARYRVLAPSLRGFYPNGPAGEGDDLSLEMHAADLAALLEALDLPPVHLVGSSSGAFIALLLARRCPERVRSLVLAEPPVMSLLGLHVPPGPLEMLKLLVRSPATVWAVAKFGATGIGPAQKAFLRGEDERGLRMFVRGVLGRRFAAEIDDSLRAQLRDNLAACKAQLLSGLPWFSPADARAILMPTLLVTGEHSAPVHHHITARLERLLPDAGRVHIRDASHLMFSDQPRVFNQQVLSFLAEC